MTQRQQAFILRLAAEKVLPDTDQGVFVRRMVDAINAGIRPRAVTVSHASRIIDFLLDLPNAQAPTAAPREVTAPDVEAGRYALVADDGTVKFYAVDRPTDGRWAGYVFLNALGSEERYPIRNRVERDRILGLIAADVHGARVRYGLEIGRCGFCGRALTDETSRAAGVGPDCADRYGVDRTVYTEIARAQAAARERGDYRDDGEDDGVNLGASLAVAS